MQIPEELRPCPFCGGRASFERIGDHRKSCIVSCDDCGAWLETGEEGERCGGTWNHRARDAEWQARVNKLAEALQRIRWQCPHPDEYPCPICDIADDALGSDIDKPLIWRE